MEKHKKSRNGARSKRAELSGKEILKRTGDLPQRMEQMIAAVRGTKEESARAEKIIRPKQAKITPDESLKRMRDLPKRREQMIAAIRKSKNRGVPA